MRDYVEALSIMFIAIIVIAFGFLLITLPFAFFGWAILTVIGIFLQIPEYSYFATTGVGFATIIVIGLIRYHKS